MRRAPNVVGTFVKTKVPSAPVSKGPTLNPVRATVTPAMGTLFVSRTTPRTTVNGSPGATSTWQTPVAPSLTAVMKAEPRARPVIKPSGSTVATEGLLVRYTVQVLRGVTSI